jgi:hypothetical protein
VIKYSTVVNIARPPSVVYASLLDGAQYEKWTEMVDSRFEGSGAPSVGTRGHFRFAKGPPKGNYEMVITRLEPDRRLDIRVTGQALVWDSRSTLEQEDGGTEMTYAGEIRLKGWHRLLEPLMRGEVQKGEASEATHLKALLESEQ